ncbi:hypothetical protein NE237_030331 [Protea cynaroides]|uniref:Uncharacterized protein n=1 Tax=Protea cynaroides TaxID=273540 RepID=A0A9Q0GXM3_9MAGN|nr:hypothetical protein NE237_030331 [Protea cynaroides]
MSNRSSSSSLASCFRSTTLTMDLDPPLAAVPTFDTANLSTCVYNIDLGVFAVTWCCNVIGRVLHMDLRLDNQDEDLSFRLNIKPFLFWWRHRSKRFNLNNPTRKVQIFWDLTKIKFDSGSEAQSGFYVVVAIDGEMILVVGDSCDEAYRKTRAKARDNPFYYKERACCW